MESRTLLGRLVGVGLLAAAVIGWAMLGFVPGLAASATSSATGTGTPTATRTPARSPTPSATPAGARVRALGAPGVSHQGAPPASRPVPASRTAASVNASYTVNTSSDSLSEGGCAGNGAGRCSLREALTEANALPAGSTITVTLPAGAYTLTMAIPLSFSAASTLTVNGAGAATTTVDGNNAVQVLSIGASATVALNGLTITHGNTSAPGGGIANAGTLTITNSVISSNSSSASGFAGGGIYNSGTLTLNGSTISGNTATAGFGGGIENVGTVTLNGSALSGNSAPSSAGDGGAFSNDGGTISLLNGSAMTNNSGGRAGGGAWNGYALIIDNSSLGGNSGVEGGAIFNTAGGTVTITNSTLSNNKASGSAGGAIWNVDSSSSVSLSNSTVSQNTDTGGGAVASFGSATLTNVTVAGNSPNGLGHSGSLSVAANGVSVANSIIANSGAANCVGAITDLDYNLETGSSCGFTRPHSLANTDPKLGPLGNNGGLTQTMGLLNGSPAIDAAGTAATNPNGCPATDQRGVARPQGPACDIGAFELQVATPTPTPIPTSTLTPTPVPTSTPTPVPTSTPTPVPQGGGGGGSAGGGAGGAGGLSGGTSAPGSAGAQGFQQGTSTDALGNTYTTSGGAAVAVSGVLTSTTTTATGTTTTINFTAAAQVLATTTGTAGSQVSGSASFSAASGATVQVGNVIFNFGANALTSNAGSPLGNQPVTVTVSKVVGATTPGGPGQFSINGTVFQVTVTVGSQTFQEFDLEGTQAAPAGAGQEIKVFPNPIDLVIKPNAADLAMARGDLNNLTVAYMIDANTPAVGNPNHYPIGTWVTFPPQSVIRDPATGLIALKTNHFTVLAAFTNPLGWVQTLVNRAPLLSSFAGDAQVFGAKAQFAYLQVTEPQIGNRFVVLDPDTNNYAYVNASDVGPSGPPPSKGSTAAVRSLEDVE